MEEIKEYIKEIIFRLDKYKNIDIDKFVESIFQSNYRFPIFVDDIFCSIISGHFGKENIKTLNYLDLGAGFGLCLLDGLKNDFNVYGIEPSSYGFNERYELANIFIKQFGFQVDRYLYNIYGENMYLFNNEKFDGIYSYQVLEYVNDIKKVLLESNRVLKKGGIAYFTFPNYNYYWEGHYNTFWIPVLFRIKKLAKIYVFLLNKDIDFIDELNFTTFKNIKKIAINVFKDSLIITIPRGGSKKFIGKYLYKAGIISLYYKLLENNLIEESYELKKRYIYLKNISFNKLRYYNLISKILLFLLQFFIADIRLIVIKKNKKIKI